MVPCYHYKYSSESKNINKEALDEGLTHDGSLLLYLRNTLGISYSDYDAGRIVQVRTYTVIVFLQSCTACATHSFVLLAIIIDILYTGTGQGTQCIVCVSF